MFVGLNPRMEQEIVQALDERPIALPLTMLVVCAAVAIAIVGAVYGIGMLLTSADTAAIKEAVTLETAIRCALDCVSIR